MSYFPLLLLTAQALFSTVQCDSASSLRDNSPSCTCYSLDSEADTSYFLNHRFYDFRNYAKKPEQYVKTPPLVEANQRYGLEQISDPDILNSSKWNSDWGVQNWGKKASAEAPVAMQNSPQNVYIGTPQTISIQFFLD